jgi:hypothetical protein
MKNAYTVPFHNNIILGKCKIDKTASIKDWWSKARSMNNTRSKRRCMFS